MRAYILCKIHIHLLEVDNCRYIFLCDLMHYMMHQMHMGCCDKEVDILFDLMMNSSDHIFRCLHIQN